MPGPPLNATGVYFDCEHTKPPQVRRPQAAACRAGTRDTQASARDPRPPPRPDHSTQERERRPQTTPDVPTLNATGVYFDCEQAGQPHRASTACIAKMTVIIDHAALPPQQQIEARSLAAC